MLPRRYDGCGHDLRAFLERGMPQARPALRRTLGGQEPGGVREARRVVLRPGLDAREGGASFSAATTPTTRASTSSK